MLYMALVLLKLNSNYFVLNLNYIVNPVCIMNLKSIKTIILKLYDLIAKTIQWKVLNLLK